MLIICEGVDGSGKSTLVDELKRRLPKARVLHRGPPQRDPLEEYELDLQDYQPGTGQHVICDRWHVGEMIYGPLYRGESKLKGSGAWHIEALLQSRGAVLVHLDLDLRDVQRRLAKRGEDYLQAEHVEHVHREYKRLFRQTPVRTLTFSEQLTRENVDHILEVGAHYECKATPLAAFTTYVGPTSPTILALGEKRGPTDQRFTTAFAPLGGTSGKYLLDAILPGSPYQLGLANALEEDVPQLVKMLRGPAVVTLGVAAHQHLEELEIEHGAVPHPQWVRRFAHNHAREYAAQFFTAAIDGEDRLAWRP